MKKILLTTALLFSILCSFASFAAEATTWNPADKGSATGLSNGNLDVSMLRYEGWTNTHVRATNYKESGKLYWEVKILNQVQEGDLMLGVANSSPFASDQGLANPYFAVYYDGRIYGVESKPVGVQWAAGDTIGIALNLESRKITYYKNNVLLGLSETYNIPVGKVTPLAWLYNSDVPNPKISTNFGASPFQYAPPTGYTAYDAVPVPPVAPTALTAAAGDSKINLTWSAVTGATTYNVKRSTTATGPYTQIANNITTNTYSDASAVAGTKYFYVVTAVGTDGESSNSNEASATITAVVTPPAVSNSALVLITMTNGSTKEFEMTGPEVDAFTTWYTAKSNGSGSNVFIINKRYNLANFNSRKVYISFDKISDFEVMDFIKEQVPTTPTVIK